MKTHGQSKAISIIAFCAMACGASEGSPTDAGTATDAKSGVDCTKETRKDTFAPGMSKIGAAGFAVELVSAEPSPPARFSNAWKVHVRDPQGAPRNATLQVTPWMPDHNHGAPTKPIVSTTNVTGEYQIDQISLWMPGLWQVKLHLEDGSASDDLTFAFCIEE